MHPISIQLYTVRQYLESEGELEVLAHIARAGYDAVECGIPENPKEYFFRCQDLGLGVSSCFGPIPTSENIPKIIAAAKELQIKNVVCGFWTQEFESMDAIKKTSEIINPAVDALAKEGLKLCLHNHWFEFDVIDGKFAVEHLLDLCPGLNQELDIYWASGFGENDVPAYVKKHKSHIPLLHVKDGPLVKGEPHTALGKGKLHLNPIIKAADPEVLEWLVVEIDECGTDMWTAVEQSAAWLRNHSG